MTKSSDQQVYLCSTKPSRMVLDWEGRLPYPKSNITPAHELPDPPDDTDYLIADPTSVTLKTAGDTDTVTISGGSAPYTIQTAPDSAIAAAELSGTVLTLTAVAEGTTSLVIADSQVPAKTVTIPITVDGNGAQYPPPATQNVDSCDAICQATAPMTVAGGLMDVNFNYTASVEVIAGVMSKDFTSVWWLTDSCTLSTSYAQAATNAAQFQCDDLPLPAGSEQGWVFWMVAPTATADFGNNEWWNTGVYELMWYAFP